MVNLYGFTDDDDEVDEDDDDDEEDDEDDEDDEDEGTGRADSLMKPPRAGATVLA